MVLRVNGFTILPPDVVVEPGTPLKWHNDSGEDALIFACGAPAKSKAEVLESS
ncbi:MAG TPA: hypothetical protein VFR38_03090 [Gaiellaceae bacterium]|nr:hypothetical protein [Gaiellaceae bacterium]